MKQLLDCKFHFILLKMYYIIYWRFWFSLRKCSYSRIIFSPASQLWSSDKHTHSITAIIAYPSYPRFGFDYVDAFYCGKNSTRSHRKSTNHRHRSHFIVVTRVRAGRIYSPERLRKLHENIIPVHTTDWLTISYRMLLNRCLNWHLVICQLLKPHIKGWNIRYVISYIVSKVTEEDV